MLSPMPSDLRSGKVAVSLFVDNAKGKPAMNKTSIAFLALCLAAAANAEGELTKIDLSGLDSSKVNAGTPSAYKDRGAIYAFNGAGMSGNTHGTAANNAMFMLSANNSGSFPWYIQVDLGATQRIDAVRLYNFNFSANDTEGKPCTIRGVREFKLYVSTKETWQTSVAGIQQNYTLVLSNQLAQASGTASYTGEYFTLASPVNARFVALVALDDYDDSKSNLNYNGISEIQLFSGGDPLPDPGQDDPPDPPASEPQFSVCCVGDSITEGTTQDASAYRWTYRLYLPDALSALGYTNVAWKGSHVSSYSGSALPSEGWSGQNAAQVAAKYIANAEGDRADFLLLHSGHNYDASNAGNISSVVAAVTNAHAQIIAAARAKNPKVVVLEAKVITSGKLPKYQYIPTLNEAIGVLASRLNTVDSPVVVVDMSEGWDYATHCISDMVHPNETGARLMAERWAAAIRAAIESGPSSVLIEAESFDEKGGWVVDPQFVDVMGSPYLLAHGRGVPVADASTRVRFGATGPVRAWVRTRDWTPDWDGEKPGRFALAIDGTEFPNELGIAPSDWGWVDAGVVNLEKSFHTVSLADRTGFEGRCDAVYLTYDTSASAPPNDTAVLAAWRAEKRGESAAPEDVVEADLVVVGGGIAGTCAAVAAADAGMTVALVQDRPMLGGNASDEVRVRTEKNGHEFHWIVNAVKNKSENAKDKKTDDANRLAFVQGKGVATHLGWRAYGVVTNAQRKIVAVDARHVETGARRRFVAPLYVDATGDGWLGYWAGAEYRMGREAKSEYDEQNYAQNAADTCTMGNSLLWNSKTGSEPYVFPSVPWATKVSGTRADTKGDWTWEAGLGANENTIYDAEMLRDRLFRAIYGSFYNAKQKDGNENLVFNWVPYIAGKRESRRIMGDYVVRESDVVNARKFEDAIGIATWTIDLHFYSGNSGFISSTIHQTVPNWWMPYRSLCCRDVPNLFLAGRCASYTHVAFGSSRVMNAGGQQGVAAGYAASLCKKYGCRPREIYRDADKTVELQALINKNGEYEWPVETGPKEVETVSVIVDNADGAGVEISGSWPSSSYNSDRYGANYLHNNKVASEDLWVRYTPEIPSNATYVVSLFWNGDDSRGSAVPVEIVYDGGVTTSSVNMTVKSSTWNAIGSWPFAVGQSGSVRILTIGQEEKTVIADAVKFAVVEVVEVVQTDDMDENGLTDAWERRYFLQVGGVDPSADPDGDGHTNLEECRLGSDPNDPHTPFSMSGINAASEVELSVSWMGAAGRTYQLYRAESLDDEFLPYGEPVAGIAGEMSVGIPKGESPSAFFRVKVNELD